MGPFLLPQSGTYTVTVQGSSPDDAGNYKLRVLDLSEAPTLAPATETKQTMLDPAQADIYQFQGTAGDVVDYNALVEAAGLGSSQGLLVALIGPGQFLTAPTGIATASSLYLGDARNSSGPVMLPNTGTYYLMLAAAYGDTLTTASYDFQLLDAAAAPLVSGGTPVAGTLASGVATQLYRINAVAGQEELVAFGNPSDPSQHPGPAVRAGHHGRWRRPRRPRQPPAVHARRDGNLCAGGRRRRVFGQRALHLHGRRVDHPRIRPAP